MADIRDIEVIAPNAYLERPSVVILHDRAALRRRLLAGERW